MKSILLIAAAAIVAGCAVGFSLTYFELAQAGSVGLGSPVDALQARSASVTAPGQGRPRCVIVGGISHDFGVMEKGATKSHVFVVKNEGTAPLMLTKGETSCKCTISALTNNELAPGESTEVRLEWTPKAYESTFSQTAEIHTNDPVQRIVILTIKGRVIESVRASPQNLALGAVSSNEPATAELELFHYADQPLEITEINWGTTALADHFSAEILPLPEEALESDEYARGGKLVKIHIKPGLPLGPINQKIRLTTNIPELPVLEVPMVLTVTGDISVVGRRFMGDTNTLMLGRIRSEEGYASQLNLLVKGPQREQTEVRIGEVDPADVLKVTLGEKVPLKGGAVYKIPLEITIPPGSRAVNHISTRQTEHGKIVLETNYADIKQFTIYVRFAVEE